MKRYPLHLIQQHQPRRDEKFSKVLDIDPVLFVTLEVDAGFGEKLDRFGGVHVVAIVRREKREGGRRESIVSAELQTQYEAL